jgi:hypothetical protein
MPNIAVDAMSQSSAGDAGPRWVQLWNLGSLYPLDDMTRGEKETFILTAVNLFGSERPRRIFWPAVTQAALNAQSPYVYPLGSTGNDALDDVVILTGNDVPDDVAIPTRNWDQPNDLLRAYTGQAFLYGMAEGETGFEEHLFAEFRNRIAHHSVHISKRLQGFIDRYENCILNLEPVPAPTLIKVKHLVAWLSQQDANMYATVTDDGILALEATLASVGRLFVEVDRSGAVEATVVSKDLGIRGLDVTTISEIISTPIVSLIGGP